MAWESVSGRSLGTPPVDAHLLRRVLKPSGVGKLGPFLYPVHRPGLIAGSLA
jgi:hypothetical protein